LAAQFAAYPGKREYYGSTLKGLRPNVYRVGLQKTQPYPGLYYSAASRQVFGYEIRKEGDRAMHKMLVVLILGVSVAMAGQDPSKTQSAPFKVLNPWAEVDPMPPRGISPRLDTLAGKKIGLFANFKRASRPILASVEKRLRAMYPDCETSLFDSRGANVLESETKNREQFTAWAKGVDAVILAVGD
jgi:hypothetical protein